MAHNGLYRTLALAAVIALGTPTRAAARQGTVGPGPRPVDEFHPANQPAEEGGRPAQPRPAYGGRVVVHLESMPKGFNRALDNSFVTRAIHHAIHESLVRLDLEEWDYRPNLARSWDLEDMVVMAREAAGKYEPTITVPLLLPGTSTHTDSTVVYGKVTEEGQDYVVTPVSGGDARFDGERESAPHLLSQPVRIAKDDVAAVARGSVFTFHLRDDAIWHPGGGFEGHELDARDVYFSWNVYNNPDAECDQVRFQFTKVTEAEIVDPLTVRMFYESQYYHAIESIGVDMCILPSHLYDLTDPDNKSHDANASLKQQADFINENPHNQEFVGLGPYRLATVKQEYIEAERFDDYFDDAAAGHFDVVRYRYISDDNAAFQALINEELDFFYRVKSADYFGSATEQPEFVENFYKGYYYDGSYAFTVWNTFKPSLADPVVRRAMAHAFDFEDYKRTNYKGLCNQVTGPFPFNSLAYDHSVELLVYDPSLAEDLLDEAGWYDRNGNDIRDKDGVELEIEYLMPSGNEASKNFGLKLQESLAEVGIKLKIAQLEWATFSNRLQDREFDAGNMAWMPALESDPEQIWHSRWGRRDARGSNYAGFRDEEVDRLIDAGQRELDREARLDIWHRIHRRIYELQPYLFMYNVPRKFAMNKKIRGFQSFAVRPGYSVRRWYFAEGTPGTRATLRGN